MKMNKIEAEGTYATKVDSPGDFRVDAIEASSSFSDQHVPHHGIQMPLIARKVQEGKGRGRGELI